MNINFVLGCSTAVYMLMILLGHLTGLRIFGKKWDTFATMISLDFFLLVADAGSTLNRIIAPHLAERYFLINKLMYCLFSAVYYLLLLCFVQFITEYIAQRTPVSPRFLKATAVVCILSAVIWSMITLLQDRELTLAGQGPFYWGRQFCGYFVLGVVLLMICRYREVLSFRQALSLLSFVFFPALGVLLRSIWHNIIFLPIAYALSIMLIGNSLLREQAVSYVEQEAMLAKTRSMLMVSQIRPHFLYNVLNSIYVLCGKEPEAAQHAVSEFSDYLRANLEGMESEALISLEQELDHVKHYLYLEKLRFREDLNVKYDIQTLNIFLPPLTLQPLVENAVKHGIMKKKGGGTVKISSKDCGSFGELKVEDDGVGFNPEEPFQDEEIHLGLQNVKNRLWLVSHATMKINSKKGSGTEIVIQIPYKEKEDRQ